MHFRFLSFLSCLVRSYLSYGYSIDMIVVMLSNSRCASLAMGFRVGSSEAFSWDFVLLGGLRSGSCLVDLVYRMAYPLVTTDG